MNELHQGADPVKIVIWKRAGKDEEENFFSFVHSQYYKLKNMFWKRIAMNVGNSETFPYSHGFLFD